MTNFSKTTLSIAAALLLTSSLSAKNIAEIETNGNNVAEGTQIVDGPKVLNKQEVPQSYTQRVLYSGAEIEKAIDDVRTKVFDLHASVVDMQKKKLNPIKADVQNYELGADKDTRDILAITSAILLVDKTTYSEQDQIALEQLKKEVKILNTTIETLSKKIPVGDKGLMLAAIRVPVLGTTKLQVFPVMDGEEQVGSVRVRCGASLIDDQITNYDSVNYCMGTVWSNSATRINDAHPKETTDTFFISKSEAYVPGKVNFVTLVWDTQPKVSVRNTLRFHGITDAASLAAMSYTNTMVAGDGTKYPGKDALIIKH